MFKTASGEKTIARSQPGPLRSSQAVKNHQAKAMRVLMIGNAESVHMQHWAQSVSKRKVEVAILSSRPRPIAGVRTLSAAVPGWRPWRPSRWHGRYRSLFRQTVRQERPDIVHVQSLGPHSVVLRELGRARLFVSTWGSDILELQESPPDARARKVAILRAATRVLASSNMLAEATCAYAGLERDQVTTLYWGVDLDVFRPVAKLIDAPVVGFIKHLRPVYGPDILIDAFARVIAVRPDSRLWMIGTGPMEGQLKQLAQRNGIAEAIQWLGAVPHEDVPALMGQMALTVMPSRSEALGVAALESQAMAVPVVATNVGGIPEIVTDGETGILTPPDNSEALARAILKLLNDDVLRRQLGQNARRRVEQLFNWHESVDRMIGYYREACSG